MSATRKATRHRQRRRRLLRALIVSGLFVLGLSILIYPSAAAWINQAQQSAIIQAYTDEVGLSPPESLAEAIDSAHAYNSTLTGGAVVGADRNIPNAVTPGDSAGYADQLDANGTGLMARLKIPSIAVDLPIYHGTSDQTLLEGVGHLEGTALPVGGLDTHSVLTAHRGLAEAELFTNLDRLSVGDTFTVEVFRDVLTYRVIETKVVDPADTATLVPLHDRDLVTLVTCTPLGVNTQRILVTGERVDPTPPEDLDAAGARPEIPGFPWWLVYLTLGSAGAVLYVVIDDSRRGSIGSR